MLPTPRVVAIDDEPGHLEGLAKGLNQYGTACLRIHYTGDMAAIPPCPHIRVIFADLHLGPGGGSPEEHAQYFGTIGGLLEETLRPSGPYVIVLWTEYPDQADGLHAFLKDRLRDVPKPFAVQALNKEDHLDTQGTLKNPEPLVKAIKRIVDEQPQIGALLNWEERVLGAAADAVSSVMDLAESAAEDMKPGEEVGRLLASLAAAAVGEEHVGEDRFRAVNEGLLPILGDHIASMRSREDDGELWRTALGEIAAGRGLSLDEAARLNRLLHIAPSTSEGDGAERGAVIDLPGELSGEAFAETFDLTPEEAAEKQFWRKEDADRFRWVLVQTQAACDYAQAQPGPLPFHLGLCLPASEVRKEIPPAALWRSPCFECEGQAHFLHVNARFQVSLPSGKAKRTPLLFRLREQLLNDLIYKFTATEPAPGLSRSANRGNSQRLPESALLNFKREERTSATCNQ